ncbi:MAG TPA: hypothetical protein GXX28_04970, partial [Firmicutes bacterium]|nr:hypothetical protein [Bacillota bacterium]
RSALALLETEMAVGRTPLPQAAERVAQSAPGPEAGSFFQRLAAQLTAGLPAEIAWRNAAAEVARGDEEAYLVAPGLRAREAEDLEPLALLGGVIGATDLSDQLKHLALARERLANREAQAAEEARRLVPVFRYGGLAAGLLLTLLLV